MGSNQPRDRLRPLRAFGTSTRNRTPHQRTVFGDIIGIPSDGLDLGRRTQKPAIAGGFLLAGLQMFHSIFDSLLIFGAIHAGVSATDADWFSSTLPFNMVGGLLLVTALLLLRYKT